MRKIQFRGKCSHCDAWAYGSLVDFGEDEAPEIHGFDPFRECDDRWREITVDRDTIGQFTGLYDKNGKAIFEGDLVDMVRTVEKSRKRIMARHIVTCHNVCDWVFESLAKEVLSLMMANHSDFDSYRFEVVGNVFDNPELAQPYSLNLPERKPRQRRRNDNVEVEIVMGDVKVSTTVSQDIAQELVNKIGK